MLNIKHKFQKGDYIDCSVLTPDQVEATMKKAVSDGFNVFHKNPNYKNRNKLTMLIDSEGDLWFTANSDKNIVNSFNRADIKANKLTLDDLIGDNMNTKTNSKTFQDGDYFDVSSLSNEEKFEFAKKLHQLSKSVYRFRSKGNNWGCHEHDNVLQQDCGGEFVFREKPFSGTNLELSLVDPVYSIEPASQLEPSLHDLLERIQAKLPDGISVSVSNQSIYVYPDNQCDPISIDTAILLAKTFNK